MRTTDRGAAVDSARDSVTRLACDLIARPSVTPEDKGCQELLATRLQTLGFSIEHLRYGEVDNLWARWGDSGPLLVFAGHTDVVPTGPAEQWKFAPFSAHIDGDTLHGRGAADMKGSLAAMLVAIERQLADPAFRSACHGSIGLLITSDEEGPAKDGTVRVVEHLSARGEGIDYCVVGEPSSTEKIADLARHGRRGSLNGTLTVHGVQGHVAYPHLAENPIHRVVGVLDGLAKTSWDGGNDHFPPTSFQISNFNSGTGATNVIPGSATILFNFRFSTESSAEGLQAAVHHALDSAGVSYDLQWHLSGNPFLTQPGRLTEAVNQAVRAECGYEPTWSTGGGTSDGRFIAPAGADVVELGPCNATIHKIDEQVSISDLNRLSSIYGRLLTDLLCTKNSNSGA